MRTSMTRPNGRPGPAIGLLVTLTLVTACSSPGTSVAPPTPGAAAPSAAASAVVASLAPSAAPSPSASPVSFVRPDPTPVQDVKVDKALTSVWSASGPASTRPWTWSPTVDPDGRIWAASSFDDTFWIVDRNGAFIEAWGGGGSGDGDGQFRFAAEGNGYGDVTFAKNGDFYVADTGNARVQQFDQDRRFVRSFGSFGTGPGEFVLPLDIDIDDAGQVYVYDGSRNDVQVFDPDGRFLRTAATHVGPYEAVDGVGNVYAVDNDPLVLYRYTPAGTVDLAVDLKPLVTFATGMDIGPDGDIYVATSDTGGATPTYMDLLRFGSDGTLKQLWPTGAEGVAIDPAGDRVYLTGSNVFTDIHAYELPAD